jgi:hypothetical protein
VISYIPWYIIRRGDKTPGDFRSFDDGYRYYASRSWYNESEFVFVDPHVLGSPVLADVNNDGHVEVRRDETRRA